LTSLKPQPPYTAILWLCLAISAPAEEVEVAEEGSKSWVDSGRDRLVHTADDLANWADGFFGNPQSDLEATATSRLRLRPEFRWDESDGEDWKLRATGRLHLPQVDRRLSLVFFGDDGDAEAEFYDPALSGDGDSSAGLQYEVARRKAHRVDLLAAMKSGPKGKVSARYRYQSHLWKKGRFRFSQEAFWIGGDGFGTLGRVDIDRRSGRDTLIRWANKAEYDEESEGVEWSSRLARIKRLNEKSAFRLFAFVRGETDPSLLESRGFGAAYRHRFLRDWIYWEVEPRYAWRKQRTFADREGAASVRLRLEILFSSE